jgi:hypothetical protein
MARTVQHTRAVTEDRMGMTNHRRLPAVARRWLPAFAQLLVLVVVAGALLWPAPIERGSLPAAFPVSDLFLTHWPNLLLIKERVAESGSLPLWNPHYGGGRPVAADPLAALWYPPTHLVHLLSVRDTLLVLMAGHLLLAGAGMLLLARRAFRLPALPALVAAVGYMATPRLVAHLGAGHVTMVQAAAWLPWVALAGWATVRDPARWAVPLAGTLAMLLLAGHPQIAYYGVLLLAVQTAWLLARRWREDGRRAAGYSALGIAAAGALALLLAGVHLLPLREFTTHSTRESAVGTTDATTLWPIVKALAGFWMPTGVPHEAMFDPGRVVLALAIIGALWRWRVGLPLLGAVALLVALALGAGSPLFDAAAWLLPEFDRFRGIARIWFLALVAIAPLAGLGTAALMRLAGRVSQRGAVAAGLLCLVGVAASLVWVDRGLTHVADVGPMVEPNEVELAIAAEAGDGSVYGAQRNVRQAIAVELGLRLVDGQDPLLIDSHVDVMRLAGGYEFDDYPLSVPPFQVYEREYPTYQYPDPSPTLLGLLGVSVVASWFPVDHPLLEKFAYIDNTHLYRNLAYSGRARLYAPGPDGRPPSLEGRRPLDATVAEVASDPQRAVFDVTSARGGYLVLGWPAFPGWQARLDGRPVPVETVDGLLPSVRVGPGDHRLTWVYEPASVRWGGLLTAIGLLVSVTWLARHWVMRALPQRARRAARAPASAPYPPAPAPDV